MENITFLASPPLLTCRRFSQALCNIDFFRTFSISENRLTFASIREICMSKSSSSLSFSSTRQRLQQNQIDRQMMGTPQHITTKQYHTTNPAAVYWLREAELLSISSESKRCSCCDMLLFHRFSTLECSSRSRIYYSPHFLCYCVTANEKRS